MKRVICGGCGVGEDLTDPSGNIHTVQLVDVHPMYTMKGDPPDGVIEEDLCKDCRNRIRREFFGEVDGELLEMPLMRNAL